MKTNQGGKFTDIRRGFVKMLESYKNIRSLIYKLTDKNFQHINDIDKLIQEAQATKNIKERQTRHFAQLQLIQEAQNKIKSYLTKADPKLRRYDVYSHIVCFLELIKSKIIEFVPRNIDICRVTPQLMRWKLFLSELNESKEILNVWLKQNPSQNKKLRQNNNRSATFYKITTAKATQVNTPSTAYMTMLQTPRGNTIEKQPAKIEKKAFSFLKRSQSATKEQMSKKWKTNYPMKIRSPEDKGINSKENSILQCSIQGKKLTRRSNRKKLFYKIEPQNLFSKSIQIIQLKEGDLPVKEFKKKTSLEFQQNQNPSSNKKISDSKLKEEQAQMLIAKAKYEALMNSKKLQRSQRRSSLRKIKQTMIQTQANKSAFATEVIKDVEKEQQELQQEQKQEQKEDDQSFQQVCFLSGEKVKSKRGKNKKNNFNFDDNIEQCQNQEQRKMKSKKNAHLKLQRQPLFQESINSLYCNQTFPKKLTKDKRSGRRNGIISSKQMVTVLGRLQTKMKQDERERQRQLKKKTIEMNERLINQLQMTEGAIFHIDEQNLDEKKKLKSFEDFYRDLAQLKMDQIKEAKASPWGKESSFFIQQNFLREQKSRQLQEYIKKLQQNNHSVGEVFEIKSEDSNIKMQNYMMMERKLAFQSQNQWIKNHHNTRADTNDSIQLMQQEYPSSTVPQSIQRF